MKLVLLGTGGYYPTPHRQTACVMLPEIGVVLDAGTGMYRLGDYLQTDRLDIFLTHAHLDHVAGLTYLINILPPRRALRNHDSWRSRKTGCRARALLRRRNFSGSAQFQVRAAFRHTRLHPSGTLKYFPLAHPGGAIGYRLDWPDRSLAYVTDTTATADAPYADAIRGVDILLHEAYFVDDFAKSGRQNGAQRSLGGRRSGGRG